MQMDTVGILDIACDDASALQRQLNDLYDYENDIPTKVYHRSRIALFQSLLRLLLQINFGCRVSRGAGLRPESHVCATREPRVRKRGTRETDRFRNSRRHTNGHSQQYDFILCIEVIEHTSKPDEVIQSILSMLARGVAIVSLPNCVSIGYLTAYVAAFLKRGRISAGLRDHMSYPFFKGPRLFKNYGATILRTAGVNCLFNDAAVVLASGMPLFHALNALNFSLSKRWPFKYFSQFFFFALRDGNVNHSV
jgi:hypothetical protein